MLTEKDIFIDRSKQVSGPSLTLLKPLPSKEKRGDTFTEAADIVNQMTRGDSSDSANSQPDSFADIAFIKKQTRVVRQGKKIRK